MHGTLAIPLPLEPGLDAGLVVPAQTLQPRDLLYHLKVLEADDAFHRFPRTGIFTVLLPGLPHYHPAGVGVAASARGSGAAVWLRRGRDRRGGADARGNVGFSAGIGGVGEVGEGKVADRAIVGFFEMRSMLCNGGVGMRKGTSTLGLLELGPPPKPQTKG